MSIREQCFLKLEMRLMLDPDHRWLAGEELNRDPSDNDLGFLWIVVHQRAKSFREWFKLLSFQEQNRMLQVSSNYELFLLVYCGILPDPLGWFDGYEEPYPDQLELQER